MLLLISFHYNGQADGEHCLFFGAVKKGNEQGYRLLRRYINLFQDAVAYNV